MDTQDSNLYHAWFDPIDENQDLQLFIKWIKIYLYSFILFQDQMFKVNVGVYWLNYKKII